MAADDPYDDSATIGGIPPFVRGVLGVSLMLGVGNGAITLTGTQDRFTGAQAEAAFELRDERIKNNASDISEIRWQVKQIDETHPPPELIKAVDDLDNRTRKLEINEARNGAR